MLTRLEGMRNITMPNFFKTGLSKAEILRFFDFPNGRCRHLFFKSPNFLANSVQRIKTHEHVKILQNRSIGCEDIKIIQFFKIAGDAILDFQICEILLADSVGKAQTHHRAKCRQNWSTCCGDIAFFRIFKMADAAMLDFWNSEILLAIGAEKVETHQHAKLCENRSIGCEDIKIFFDFSRWRPPPSWIVKFTKLYWLTVAGGPRRITLPNFVKIGRSTAEMLQFFEFSRWPPQPFWIFKIAKFYCQLGSRGSRRISMPNFVKIGQSFAKIFFQFFNMVAAAILDCRIHKILLADRVWMAQTHHCTKIHQNRLVLCGDIAILRNFKMAAAAILDFWNREILLYIVVERV